MTRALAGLMSLLLGAGCRGTTGPELCEQWAEECGYTAEQISKCAGNVLEAEERAKSRGCGEVFNDLICCLEEHLECDGNFTGCEEEVSVLESCLEVRDP